jgi:non-specific serine/threonine protein kinase
LLRLGGGEVGQVLPPVFAYWRELGGRFATAICTRPDIDERRAEFPPPPEDLELMAAAAPVMPGAST